MSLLKYYDTTISYFCLVFQDLQTCRVVQVTLETLSTFVEWVPISFIIDIPLFKLLSKLLEIENLRMSAAMCLESIFERKVIIVIYLDP